MEETTNQQTINQPAYQTLGKKVFWLFFLQIIPAALILLLISIILFVLSSQPSLANNSFGNMKNYAFIGALIILIISLIFFAISYIFAWLIYKNYLFLMADDSFKIKRGILI